MRVIAISIALVRIVEDALVQNLRERAAAYGRSTEAEHHDILEKALRMPQH
jgi:plasmid stability protein